jgi:hypothetical protein
MVVGIVRLIIVVRIFFYPLSPDFTYQIGFCTSVVEGNIAIMTASAAAMKPLFKKWFPRLFSTLSASGRYTDGPYERGTPKYIRNETKGTNSSRIKSTIKRGPSHFELKNMRGLTEIQSSHRDRSEEEIMTFDGIVKTTNVSVRYAENPEDT